jgi:hypothetical protein
MRDFVVGKSSRWHWLECRYDGQCNEGKEGLAWKFHGKYDSCFLNNSAIIIIIMRTKAGVR